jgi:hypothetical protein
MVRSTPQLRLRPAALLAVAAACVLAAVAALFGTGLVGASGDTVLTLVPTGAARAGELITVKLVATNASDLAGFQGTVQYDAAGLRLTGASVDAGLERSGRGLVPLGPVMREGSVVLGAATCPVSDCGSTPGRAGPRVEAGVSGSVELGTLEFYSDTPGSYHLSLDGVTFVDPQGNPLVVRAEPLVLDVRP